MKDNRVSAAVVSIPAAIPPQPRINFHPKEGDFALAVRQKAYAAADEWYVATVVHRNGGWLVVGFITDVMPYWDARRAMRIEAHKSGLEVAAT